MMKFAGNVRAAAETNLVIYGSLLTRPFPAGEIEILVKALAQEADSGE
jgi:hypothetical protein